MLKKFIEILMDVMVAWCTKSLIFGKVLTAIFGSAFIGQDTQWIVSMVIGIIFAECFEFKMKEMEQK